MKKQNQMIVAALLFIAAPLAQAGEVKLTKSHEEISFNAMISQGDAEAEALRAQMARVPASSEDEADVTATTPPAADDANVTAAN